MEIIKMIILMIIPVLSHAQIKLQLAERYLLYSDSSLYENLEKENYSLQREDIIDSIHTKTFTHDLGYDKIMIMGNHGLMILPVANDTIDYYYDYILQTVRYFSDTSDVVESLNQITSPYNNEALEIVLKNGLIYVYSPRESSIVRRSISTSVYPSVGITWLVGNYGLWNG